MSAQSDAYVVSKGIKMGKRLNDTVRLMPINMDTKALMHNFDKPRATIDFKQEEDL